VDNPDLGEGHVKECDCNNPSHWDGDAFYVFNSASFPWRSSGPDLPSHEQSYLQCVFDNEDTFPGGRWIESTHRDGTGTLYGWSRWEVEFVRP
jgi:hypothetical protein